MSLSPPSASSPPALLAPKLRPVSTPALRRPSARTTAAGLLAAWHLCSLDAPTVAALWVVFIARAAAVRLPWTEPASMFLAVWILYATDRLLDARAVVAGYAGQLELRHRFHARHRIAFQIGLLLACPLLGVLLLRATAAALRLDVALACLLCAWLLLVHLRPAASSRLPKELAVGIFFPAAVFIPTVARVPGLRPALLPDALLFAAVCSLNCLFIFAWEHPYSARHAHWTTRLAARRLPVLAIATTLLALTTAAWLYCLQPVSTLAVPAAACAVSTLLLLLLHRRREHLSPLALRIAADLCLLTPFLFMPATVFAR